MTPEERLQQISELADANERAHAEIERRAAAHEADPLGFDQIKLSDVRITGDPSDLAYSDPTDTPTGAPYTRQMDSRGMLYRTNENDAQASAAAAVAVASNGDGDNSNGWNDWVKRHLENERAEVLDLVVRMVGQVIHEMRKERAAEIAALRREITELRGTLQEREERRAAVAEVRREYAGVERERVDGALAQRDVRIDALEERVQTLLKFLSLGGYDTRGL